MNLTCGKLCHPHQHPCLRVANHKGEHSSEIPLSRRVEEGTATVAAIDQEIASLEFRIRTGKELIEQHEKTVAWYKAKKEQIKWNQKS